MLTSTSTSTSSPARSESAASDTLIRPALSARFGTRAHAILMPTRSLLTSQVALEMGTRGVFFDVPGAAHAAQGSGLAAVLPVAVLPVRISLRWCSVLLRVLSQACKETRLCRASNRI